MSFITVEMTKKALYSMQQFHEAQKVLHKNFNIDFLENLGRRNVIMSHAQEIFFASEIGKVYKDVKVDGKTGAADIFVGELGKEIECKITTPSGSLSKLIFQTDFDTLSKKDKIDYIYVVADPDFEKFCVLHFDSLTVDDFFPPSASSRGRAKMNKQKAFKKVNVLFGSADIILDDKPEKYANELAALHDKRKLEVAKHKELLHAQQKILITGKYESGKVLSDKNRNVCEKKILALRAKATENLRRYWHQRNIIQAKINALPSEARMKISFNLSPLQDM